MVTLERILNPTLRDFQTALTQIPRYLCSQILYHAISISRIHSMAG